MAIVSLATEPTDTLKVQFTANNVLFCFSEFYSLASHMSLHLIYDSPLIL